MTHKLSDFLQSTLLSLLCAWSGAGCLISAFSLPIAGETVIVLLWLSWALVCSVLQFQRWGRAALLCLAAAGSFWLWWDGRFGTQLLGTLGTLASAYDSGYGFGVPAALQVEQTAADFPVLVLGLAQIYGVSRTVCRRKSNLLPLVLLLLPLAACMVVTDTVPQTPSLFGLLLGLCLLLVTDNVRRENGSQANKLFAAAVIPLALALAGLFYCFPRETYVNTTAALRENILTAISEFPQGLGKMDLLSGLSRREKVNLTVLPTQLLLGIPVAEVTAEQSGAVYLRAQDYDNYTGTAWESSSGRQDTLAGSGGARGNVRVELLGSADELLLPAFPDGQTFLLDGRAENEGGGAVRSFALREFSLAAYPGDRWLALPEATGTRCRSLIQSAAIGTESVEQTVANVAAFVQSRAVYDRTGTDMGAENEDFALWFLEQGERGYCVHFATAAAVLLRAAGIPARYVTGYRVEAKAGESVQVTSDDAHAWVEYYNYRTWGWYVLEATPGSPENTPASTTAPTEQTQAAAQPAPTAPTQETMATTQPSEAPVQTTERLKQLPRWIPMALLSVCLGALLAEMQRLVRIELRRRKQQRGSNNQRVLACGVEIRLLCRLARRSLPEELEELTQKAVFSQHMLTAVEVRAFTLYQASCRKALRSAPWWKKLVYRYIYAVI